MGGSQACRLLLDQHAQSQLAKIKLINECINDPDAVVFRDVIIRASGNNVLWLRSSSSMNRFMITSRRCDGIIIASFTFLHRLSHKETFSANKKRRPTNERRPLLSRLFVMLLIDHLAIVLLMLMVQVLE